MTLEDWDPIIYECTAPSCDNGVAGDDYCPVCHGDGIALVFDRSCLFTLAHNLAVAGAMQRMYNLGMFAGLFHDHAVSKWQPNVEGQASR